MKISDKFCCIDWYVRYFEQILHSFLISFMSLKLSKYSLETLVQFTKNSLKIFMLELILLFVESNELPSVGGRDHAQFSAVPPYTKPPRMDFGLVLGKKGGHLGCGWWPDNRVRRLLQMESNCSTLLQEGPHHC